MKVGGIRPGETRGPRRSDRAAPAEKGAFDRTLREVLAGQEDDPLAVEAPRALGAMDGLLAIQEARSSDENGDATARDRRRRQARQGEQLLDHLDRLRLRLIEGRIPQADLVALTRDLRARRDADLDPALVAILDDITLRAEVELAKLDREPARDM